MADASTITTAASRAAPVPIRLDTVSKGFHHAVKGEIFAVKEVSTAVQPGELLTPARPVRVRLQDDDIAHDCRLRAAYQRQRLHRRDQCDRAARERAQHRFCLQNYAIFPHLSVFENVLAYGLRVQQKPDDEIKRAVNEVLGVVGLSGYGQQQPHQLSGGEQQRVALARAIVFQPRILLFDEPLSNLDAKLQVQMRSEIKDLQKRLGITTVYVTHDQEEAMAISDRIAVMEKGARPN